jgi:hypothetical protein
VANSLSNEDENYEVNLLVAEIVPLKYTPPNATFLESLSLAREKMWSLDRQTFWQRCE